MESASRVPSGGSATRHWPATSRARENLVSVWVSGARVMAPEGAIVPMTVVLTLTEPSGARATTGASASW